MGRFALVGGLVLVALGCGVEPPDLRFVEATFDWRGLRAQCEPPFSSDGEGQGFNLFREPEVPPRWHLVECVLDEPLSDELADYLRCRADDMEARLMCVALRSCAERSFDPACSELALDCGPAPEDYEPWWCGVGRRCFGLLPGGLGDHQEDCGAP